MTRLFLKSQQLDMLTAPVHNANKQSPFIINRITNTYKQEHQKRERERK